MRKLTVFFLFAIMVCTLAMGCREKTASFDCLRIHIRANDNSQAGQAVKYAVKEKVADLLTPALASASTKRLAMETVESCLEAIKLLCEQALLENGFDYGASVSLKREHFPLRSYGEFVFEGGYYDALIIVLGEGRGDNWWCMVYPPLCFIGAEGEGDGKVVYRSKILEIIESFKQKYFK
jgi:stage II sporulation protein R